MPRVFDVLLRTVVIMLFCLLLQPAITAPVAAASAQLPDRGVTMSVLQLVESKPGPNDIGFLPREAGNVGVTPPSFAWLPVAGARSYELEVSTASDFATENTRLFTDIELSIFTPATIFETDETYYWRYRFVDEAGNRSAPSPVRSFYITPGAVSFPLPPLADVRARLPEKHPRLLVRPETADDLRASRTTTTGRAAYQAIVRPVTLELLLKKSDPLPAEPGNPYVTGSFDEKVWAQGMTLCRAELDGLQQLAFDYLLTGSEDAATEAKRRLLHFMSWDPRGNTSAKINDECSMPMLWGVPRAYTWLYDVLTAEERTLVQQVMRVRGEEAYNLLRAVPFERSPFDSHLGRTLGFLGETAIAFYGDIPEAEAWFDYIIQIFYALYPTWGGDDGGWAEGTSYWKHYMAYVGEFIDALRIATGLDLTDKPFFQNTGYFKLYTHSLGTGTPFGDGLGEGVTEADAQVMDWLGRRTDNGHFRWYAAVAPGSQFRRGLYGYMALIETGAPAQQVPGDLPLARHFTDVGWVAMHTDLVRPKDNIRLVFKSSPYGSYSHSHADQNAFVLDAFGEPLAIPTGYYDWYMSPHHRDFTQQTVSKNTILVNGRGQTARSLEAKGHIARFFHSEQYDYTRGEAAQAYAADMQRFDRHIVFLRPHLFVMYDDLQPEQAGKFTWMLHAWNEMEIDPTRQKATIVNGQAQLDVHFVSPPGLSFTQTAESLPKVSIDGLRPQWHLHADTRMMTGPTQFLTVLAPKRRTAEPRPDELKEVTAVAQVAVTGGTGVELTYTLGDGSDWNQTVVFRDAESMGVQGGELSGRADVLAYGTNAQGARALVVNGNELTVNGKSVLRTDRPATISVAWDADKLAVTTDPAEREPLQLRIATDTKPIQVTVNEMACDAWEMIDAYVVIALPGM